MDAWFAHITQPAALITVEQPLSGAAQLVFVFSFQPAIVVEDIYHLFHIVSNYFLLSFDEKRYTSAIVEPPVPKLYFAQMDALNDCLVIENLANVGDGDMAC